MANRSDPDNRGAHAPPRSRPKVLAALAIAVTLGAIYFVTSMMSQPGTNLEGEPEAPPVQGVATEPQG